MSGEQNTVFISYRRSTSKHLAGRIFDHLRAHGYDVFLDVTTIDSGEFDRIILNQIAARAHFVLLLSPGSLLRCANEGDWLRREIEEAFRLNRNIIPIFDEGFNLEEEKQHLPEPLRTELPRRNGVPLYHFYFDAGMETLRTRFLKQPVYDIALTPTPAAEQVEVERRIEQAERGLLQKEAQIEAIIGPRFEWCPIPHGFVTLEDASERGGTKGGRYEVPAFAIAKYPNTNWQYEVFTKSGYHDPHWWDYSPEAKQWRAKHPTPENTAFKGDDLPRTNVCWYDAVAFCRYLSDESGQKIALPEVQQWQRAAKGDVNRKYPWGNEKPDESRCNFNNNVGKPTPVMQYPKGASPYGVMDMSGNVWEWCLTEWGTGSVDVSGKNLREGYGGSWWYDDDDRFRVGYRDHYNPVVEFNVIGFRIALLY